jgi:hypothetical protein
MFVIVFDTVWYYSEHMALEMQPATFGSALRTKILVLTALLGETYSSQLARILNTSNRAVSLATRRLQRERLVATRQWGNERRISLDPTTAYSRELRALLLKIADTSPEYEEMIASIRTRPRRHGKILEPDDPEIAARARELAGRKRD